MHGTISPGDAKERAYATPLADIHVGDPGLYASDSFWPYFERLRKEDPVHYCRESEFGPYWSVTKYNDIMEVDTNHQVFSSELQPRRHHPARLPRRPATPEVHRDGPAAARRAAQDRGADVRADPPRQAGRHRSASAPA